MRTTLAACIALAAAVATIGCQSAGRRATAPHDAPAHRFTGMGDHHRTISTSSPEAQQWFDQGLVWMYAFNHDEAIRSFKAATETDPECAMAWWGIALCHGPHINNPVMTRVAINEAWSAMRKAQSLKNRATPAECALIDAVAVRYVENPPDDRTALNEAYANAMRRAYEAYPDDVDIMTLYAESLMDLQPWDLWDTQGRPKRNAPVIVATLERALTLDPNHPGANHLYIHAVEASPNPERGVAPANRLRDAVPASSHLVHMPSHIDVQVGDWAAAAEANRKATAADEKYEAISPNQGFYRVYMAHNDHFLSFSCMMQGRRKEALQAARNMIAGVPANYIRDQGAVIDPYMGIEFETMMRFGMWDEILSLPEPPRELPISRSLWRFTRAVAYAAKDDLAAAEAERKAFHAAVRKVPKDAMMAINPASKVLSIAEHVMNGEIAYRRGNIDEAVSELRAAIELEDSLLYMEPPEWIQPVRHTLGAILVDAGRYSEAEPIYRRDLEVWPENGWSLLGLHQCLAARGETAEADRIQTRFERAWANADTPIRTTCLCVTPPD